MSTERVSTFVALAGLLVTFFQTEIMNDDDEDDEELPPPSPHDEDAVPVSTARSSAERSPLQVPSHPA
jgi:hypothetical protein